MDATSTDTSLRPRNPIARRGDPATSHEAARIVTRSGRRARQAELVLDAVRRGAGGTSAEIALLAALDQQHGIARYVAARRLPELDVLGLVRRGPARKCSVSGCRAIT